MCISCSPCLMPNFIRNKWTKKPKSHGKLGGSENFLGHFWIVCFTLLTLLNWCICNCIGQLARLICSNFFSLPSPPGWKLFSYRVPDEHPNVFWKTLVGDTPFGIWCLAKSLSGIFPSELQGKLDQLCATDLSGVVFLSSAGTSSTI